MRNQRQKKTNPLPHPEKLHPMQLNRMQPPPMMRMTRQQMKPCLQKKRSAPKRKAASWTYCLHLSLSSDKAMSKDFLSQDEVDSLLKGVSGEADEVAAPAEPTGAVRPYNLASQERIVRGRMPTMEILNERFARLFKIDLFNLIRRSAEISVGQIRVQKFSEFFRNLPIP